LVFDKKKLNGTLPKVLNVESLTRLGWQYTMDLDLDLERTYRWYLKNQYSLRG